jgi:hypothetical protein
MLDLLVDMSIRLIRATNRKNKSAKCQLIKILFVRVGMGGYLNVPGSKVIKKVNHK